MNKDVKIIGDPSISDEDLEKLSDEELVLLEKPVSGPVFKARLNKVIGQRNILRTEKESLNQVVEGLKAEIGDLGEFKQLKKLIDENPRLAQATVKAIQEEYGTDYLKDKRLSGRIPVKVKDEGVSETDKRMDRLEQRQADVEIEKHFDSIGVKEKEIDKLTEFCKKQGIDMVNKTLLKMAYNEVFPEKKEEVDTKKTEPDSSAFTSGLVYGDKPIKTVKDAVEFALEQEKAKRSKK